MFRHPKYYKELRRAGVQVNSSRPAHSRCNKSDQVISSEAGDGERERSPGPGPKLQATSNKPQAASLEKNRPQASSPKQQASSSKPQASSSKI
jgi:hypothetical protein